MHLEVETARCSPERLMDLALQAMPCHEASRARLVAMLKKYSDGIRDIIYSFQVRSACIDTYTLGTD